MESTSYREIPLNFREVRDPHPVRVLSPGEWESIAGAIETIEAANFHFDYHHLPEERIPELKAHCFQCLLNLCESEKWEEIKQIENFVKEVTDALGNPLLFHFMQHKSNEKVEKILSYNLHEALSSGKFYSRSFFVAAQYGVDSQVLSSLALKGGGTPTDQDEKNRIPLHHALLKGHSHLIRSLYPKRDGERVHIPYPSKKFKQLIPECLAISKGQIACFDELIHFNSSKRSIPSMHFEGGNVLHLAIRAKRYQMLEHLLTTYHNETKRLLEKQNVQGFTPLIQAIHEGDLKTASLLIAKGASLESRDFQGNTPLHHAAILKSKPHICLLALHRAHLTATNTQNKTPLNILEELGDIELKNLLSNICNDLHFLERQSPNFFLEKPETLVLRGGGPKVIGFLGAVQKLQEAQMLSEVKRYAGTSGGAISATLLALGLRAQDVSLILSQTNGNYFLDHLFTEERLREFITSNLSWNLLLDIGRVVKDCIETESALPLLKDLLFKFLISAYHSTGICSGQRFLDWIDLRIQDETGIKQCTFGELADLIKHKRRNSKGRLFKDLHVFATKIGSEQKIVHFNSEDPKYAHVIISEAVRASMSIPLIFEAHSLILKENLEDGSVEFYTENRTFRFSDYHQLRNKIKREKNLCEPSYVDGGLLRNFPLEDFDKRKFIYNGLSPEEEEYPEFNRRTLGLSLFTPQEEVIQEASASNLKDLCIWVFKVFKKAETLLNKLVPYNSNRTIEISNQGIGLLDFSEANPLEGLGLQAVQGGYQAAESFLNQQEEKISHYLSLSHLSELVGEIGEEEVIGAPEQAPQEGEFSLAPPSENNLLKNIWDEYLIFIKANLIFSRTFSFSLFLRTGEIPTISDPLKAMQAYFTTFQRLRDTQQFTRLKSSNPPLQIFGHLGNQTMTNPAMQLYLAHTNFFHHHDFPAEIVPHLVRLNKRHRIRFLASKGIAVNVKDPTGEHTLFMAARLHTHEAFKELVQASDYDPSTVDQFGNNILHQIVQYNNLIAFNFLKEQQKLSALLNVVNTAGNTPIITAFEKGHYAMSFMLLQCSDLNLNTQEPRSKKTILYYLAQALAQNISEAKTHFLRILGIAQNNLQSLINLENQTNESLLFMIQNKNILKKLIENGINLHQTQKATDKTLLYIFAEENDLELATLFCDKYKARYGHPQFLNMLDKSAKSDQRHTNRNPVLKTALIIASEKNHFEVVKYLIEKGVDIQKRVDGKTAFDYAKKADSYAMLTEAKFGNIRRALSSAEKLTALSECCTHLEFNRAQKLIEDKIPSIRQSATDAQGNGLSLIILKSRFKIDQKKSLLELVVAKDQINRQDMHQMTSLMLAAQQSSILLDLLLRYPNINLNLKDEIGNSALHYAALNNSIQSVQKLLLKQADPNLQNMEGKTPIFFTNSRQIATLLVANGADPLIKDRMQKTACDYANLNRKEDLKNCLRHLENFDSSNQSSS